MRVKSFWAPTFPGVAIGTPVIYGNPGEPPQHKAKVVEVQKGRCLIELEIPMPWRELEETGIGFDKFHDTIDD